MLTWTIPSIKVKILGTNEQRQAFKVDSWKKMKQSQGIAIWDWFFTFASNESCWYNRHHNRNCHHRHHSRNCRDDMFRSQIAKLVSGRKQLDTTAFETQISNAEMMNLTHPGATQTILLQPKRGWLLGSVLSKCTRTRVNKENGAVCTGPLK